jgi:hypothetical protein
MAVAKFGRMKEEGALGDDIGADVVNEHGSVCIPEFTT